MCFDKLNYAKWYQEVFLIRCVIASLFEMGRQQILGTDLTKSDSFRNFIKKPSTSRIPLLLLSTCLKNSSWLSCLNIWMYGCFKLRKEKIIQSHLSQMKLTHAHAVILISFWSNHLTRSHSSWTRSNILLHSNSDRVKQRRCLVCYRTLTV